jgi:type VI protein secretion system component VasF
MESTVPDEAAHAIAQEPPESWATWIDCIVEAMEGPDLLHSEQPALAASWRARYLAMLQELQRSLQRRQIEQQRHRAVERKRCYQ